MALLERVFDGSLMPHGHCLLWRSDLLFLHIAGDVLTTISYFAIPFALVYLTRKRDDLMFNRTFHLFAGFILFCGITHLIGLINIWQGFYFLEGMALLATGLISLLTAVMLWRLMPRALSIPSREQLLATNRELAQAKEQLRVANLQLEQRVSERTRELQQLAATDPLTGIYNRGEIFRLLAKEMERARRYHQMLCILIIDLDHFKSINDRFGHLAGDHVLVDAASTFANVCRTSDSLGRYGGEEFLLALPNTDADEAAILAERIRNAVNGRQVNVQDDKVITYTCSIGVGHFEPQQTLEDLLQVADNALYRAKLEGRNRVVVG